MGFFHSHPVSVLSADLAACEYTVNSKVEMSTETVRKTVPDAMAGLRLDQALARMFPDHSRTRLAEWLKCGSVLVDGESRRPRDRVDGGESIELRPLAEPVVTSRPEAIELDVAWEDQSLLVVNKPAGLVVHPGAGNPAGTLMNGLLHHAPDLAALPRAGIIHRLDKDTTGLMLVAKTLTAHTMLTRALAERDISRHYLAICRGVLTGGGTISAPVGRHPTDRTRMTVTDRGRPAVTHFTVIERFRAHTYREAWLDTGRTHQIRVHFAHRRNPLLGDPVYGGRLALPAGASAELADALRAFRRQALHAVRLAFRHPVSGDQLSVEAPLPADLDAMLKTLRNDSA